MTGAAGPTDLTGEVAAVVFRNTRSGFAVVELRGGERAVGPLSAVVEGQPLRLQGRWETHQRHGPTFTAVAWELAAPRSVDALRAFLSSDRFPGVGSTLAERLVSAFGLDFADVVVDHPLRLADVPGVSPRLAEAIARSWRDAGLLPGLISALGAAGLPPAAVAELHRRHGGDVARAVDDDPYVVLDVQGVGWAQAERLARERSVDAADPRRLAAAPAAALRVARDRGHTSADTDELRGDVARLLALGPVEADRAIELAVRQGRVIRSHLPAGQVWALPDEAADEAALAAGLARLLASRPRGRTVDDDEVAALDPELTAAQRRAVVAALTAGVSVLAGGPGTGKTRTVGAIVAACDAADLRVALCAPTGRAAKRLEELTGHVATTVHRLLEAVPSVGGQQGELDFAFSFGSGRRLPFDVVVVDEVSMADTRLARALVEAVDDGSRLVLVGDADQLPSVGPGAVLRDVLAAGDLGVVHSHLDVIHRQAARSRIVTLAHEIRGGQPSVPRGREVDVFSVPQPPAGLADRIAEIVAVRAPAFYGLAPSDVQVLAPMYRGAGGVDRLNERIGERVNPAGGRPGVAGLREGDRVVQTRNDADLDVANGEVGEVTAVDAREGRLEVAFPTGRVSFTSSQARTLRPAWCLTVHKAQGGEWPVVVVSLDPAHRSMLYRELLYTAVTRARTGLLLVGAPELVRAGARRAGSGLAERRTALLDRLAAELVERTDGAAPREAVAVGPT